MSEKLSERAMMIDRALDETLLPHAIERRLLRVMDAELALLRRAVKRADVLLQEGEDMFDWDDWHIRFVAWQRDVLELIKEQGV